MCAKRLFPCSTWRGSGFKPSGEVNSLYSLRCLLIDYYRHYNIDKYGCIHAGGQKNIQAKIGGTYERIIMDGAYIREGMVGVYTPEGKDMRTQIYEESTFE